MNKGDDLGYFAFGGSSHAIVFQKHVNLVFSNSLYEEKDGVKSGQRQNLRSYLAHVVPAPDKDL